MNIKKVMLALLLTVLLPLASVYASDPDANQPVRLNDGTNDFGFAVATPVETQIGDGTDTATVTASGELNVILGANSGTDIGDVDVTSVIPGVGATNLGKAEDAAHTTGDTGVLGLSVRRDADTSLVDTDGDYAPLQVNATGALKVEIVESVATGGTSAVDDSAFTIATDSVTPVGYLADETTPDSVDEGDVGLARMTLDRKALSVLVDATTDSQRLAINASGEAQVDVAAHALTNANAVPISKDNSANSETNPIFVQDTDQIVSSNEVHDYDTAAAVASAATSNHDYTVVGTTFFLKSVTFAAGRAGKFEIQTGPVASLVSVKTGFTSPSTPTQTVVFDPAREVPVTSTGTVRVIRTNRSLVAQDVYSTIEGFDV